MSAKMETTIRNAKGKELKLQTGTPAGDKMAEIMPKIFLTAGTQMTNNLEELEKLLKTIPGVTEENIGEFSFRYDYTEENDDDTPMNDDEYPTIAQARQLRDLLSLFNKKRRVSNFGTRTVKKELELGDIVWEDAPAVTNG